MKKKRDSAYLKGRLKRDFPKIYADLDEGKIKNVSQAALMAGLIRKVSRDEVLIREFKLASPAEKEKFSNWLKSWAAARKSTKRAITDSSGCLVPKAVALINAWLRKEGISAGKLLSTIGKYRNYDIRLSRALKGDPIHPDILKDLEPWLRAHEL